MAAAVTRATPAPGSYSRYAIRNPVSVTATAGALATSLPESSSGSPSGPAPTSCIEHPAPSAGFPGASDGTHRPVSHVSSGLQAPAGVEVAVSAIDTSRAWVTSATVHPVASTLQSAPRAAAANP